MGMFIGGKATSKEVESERVYTGRNGWSGFSVNSVGSSAYTTSKGRLEK